MRLFPAAVVLLFAGASAVRAEDAVPVYEVPAPLPAVTLDPRLDQAARRAVATILDPRDAEGADDAVRILAGLGPAALPHVVRGLAGASWYARAGLVGAVAEMDAAEATPLLVAACRDPSYAVRRAAVLGLGKTGDARGRAALLERADERSEPVWVVRAAAATALRRAVLRGVLPRGDGEAAIVRLLADPDDDARRSALREVAPLAAEAALPTLLEVFSSRSAPASDRNLALAALRAYRTPSPVLLDALRQGFLAGDDAQESVEAGRALLALRGVAALEDEEVAAAVVHRLRESEHEALRDGLARLGRPAAPWIVKQARQLAERIAAHKVTHEESSFDELLDTLIQVDDAAGLALVRELLFGPNCDTFDHETRLACLRKVEFVYADRVAGELRTLFPKADKDLRPTVLRTIVASGGGDLGELLDGLLATEELRAAALGHLDQLPELPAGPNLLALARGSVKPEERRAALETLSRRDPALAAQIAASLLDDPRADLRAKAITLLTSSREPAHFERLVARLASEEGSDVRPAAPLPGDGPSIVVTPSEPSTDAANRRRRLRHALVQAVRTTGGERAKPVLLRVLAEDPDEAVRETAAHELRGIVAVSDAPQLVAAHAKASDATTRREILRTLATLAEAPEASRVFVPLIQDPMSRQAALEILAETDSRVVPQGVAEGLAGHDWNDEERQAALTILDRSGRAPGTAELAALVADARTLDLCGEAARVLAARPGEDATRELVTLASRLEDAERLSLVVKELGQRRAPEAEAPLLALFDKARERALLALFAADPAVDLYRRCAEAVAEFGSEKTGAALTEHLLDPRLAHAAGRLSTTMHGPFQPEESAAVAIVKTLVAAFACRDEASCRRLVAARLATLAADGSDLAIPEGYAAGVARYLADPLAYGLPARPRPAAALELWSLVLRAAPRISAFDAAALEAHDDELGQERRYAEAVDALRRLVALADVEEATRSREDRLVETCRISVRTAQSLAAAQKSDEALAIARRLREPDPASGELAYRTGWCLARLARFDEETKTALSFALAQEDKDARIHFQLGWVTECSEGPRAALRFYEQAVVCDRRRAEEHNDEAADAAGGPHEAAAYPYWFARALHAAGRDDVAAGWLAAAVALDDRLAVQARADAAFAGWDRLEPAVKAGLSRIRRGPRR